MERNLTHIALFAALIAGLGLIPKIDLISGVPITAQSLGIMLCGTVLGAKRGFLAVLLFVVLVAAGLPLLSGGRGGIGLFVGPSAGYLIGFPFAAFDLNETMGDFSIWGNKRYPKIRKFNQWNLWAGFCFYRFSRVENLKINFTHSIELRLDTGG